MLGFLAVVCNSRAIQANVIGLYISIDEQFDGPAFVVTADSDVIFCLDSDLRITSCNPGWDRFAVDNGAPGLCGPALIGRSILRLHDGAGSGVLCSGVRASLAQAQPWEHLYECSSPVLYR